jgi:hypothetical protein
MVKRSATVPNAGAMVSRVLNGFAVVLNFNQSTVVFISVSPAFSVS